MMAYLVLTLAGFWDRSLLQGAIFFDPVPPGPERSLREPFAGLKAGLELAHRPIIGEARVAGVLQEDFLLRGNLEADAMGLEHAFSLGSR